MVPDALYPWPGHYVREIRVFDPQFVPLVVRAKYAIPATGGSVFITRHAIGRHVPVPRADLEYENVLRPTGSSVNGVRLPGGAILLGIVLQGESPNQHLDIPGAYRPFDRTVVESCRRAMWRLRNHRLKDTSRKIATSEILERRAAVAAHSEDRLAEKRDDSFRIKHALGKADRVYVSDTLRKVREAASEPLLKGAA